MAFAWHGHYKSLANSPWYTATLFSVSWVYTSVSFNCHK
jgi:uncharacterized protein (DUF486 family)